MSKYNAKIEALDMPSRISRLLVSSEGFPVPWFVQWVKNGEPVAAGEGTPDFRILDADKLARCARGWPMCWICGEPLGKHRIFTIGPMCSINRIISEPPSHRDCAEYAIKACPFLSNPRMRRNNSPENAKDAAGFHLDRNPGAMALWETPTYRPFRPRAGGDGILFSLGEPTRVDWWAHGRKATREEVQASIDSGYPELMKFAQAEGLEAISDLEAKAKIAMRFLPE